MMVDSVTGYFSAPFLPEYPIPATSRGSYFSGPGKRVRVTEGKLSALVVDDALDVTEMLSVLLSHAGYEVVTATSARAALAAAKARHFDVVISDIGMPEMNGYELAEALRALPDYQNIPLVAVTGYSMFDDRERSQSSGFNAHMTKPIDPQALLELMKKL
jgi:CheY-like chemotaxis protein